MTKLEQRQQEIEILATQIIEKAQLERGGSVCLVPAGSKKGYYRVDIDEHYVPVACQCDGGKHDCKHKQACWLYFSKKLRALRNRKLNPVYEFVRAGQLIRARLSQFSKSEKAEWREQQAAEKRSAYVVEFDPDGVLAA